MGDADSLVVVDLQESAGSTLRATYDTYGPAEGTGEQIWFSWEDAPSAGATQVGPHTGGANGQPEGHFWICMNGMRKGEDPEFETKRENRNLSETDGKYPWNQPSIPMVLLILPPHRPLSYARPIPMTDGVWERNQRLCVFWGAPAVPTNYRFALGKQTNSLAGNARRWRRRTRNFRPTSRTQVAIGFVVALILIFLIAGLIALLGQATAGLWIGTVATVASLAISVIALRNTRQPNQGALSNPA